MFMFEVTVNWDVILLGTAFCWFLFFVAEV